MDIYSPLDNSKNAFTNVDTVVATEEGDTETAKLVTGVERSFALDTAALLGGNEYLIQEGLDEIHKLEYNDSERKVLRWALTELWGAKATEKVFNNSSTSAVEEHDNAQAQTRTPHNQGCLNKYFTEDNRVRLPRILSNCLLYCGRHPDTKIYANPLDHTQRYLLINLRNFPFINFPVGLVPDNSDGYSPSRFQDCEKLALIYFKLTDMGYKQTGSNESGINQGEDDGNERPTEAFVSGLARRQSESLSAEIELISKLRFGGVVPVP